ncbi:cyclin-Y-like protein 1 [Cervus canadensis]|uniref:cyclin-Y-like protein 1 n=1 Tax=Cervus canadensis TaxID=1574408 RepID=UPI001CA33C10|nr:cyclin-Y-like protein 1 [Cervus canadensis]
MGNTLSCCVCLNVNRRVGPAPDSESEVYKAAAGDPVAVAPAPAAVEPTELDFRAGEGHHLQHISDREMPEGLLFSKSIHTYSAPPENKGLPLKRRAVKMGLGKKPAGPNL